MVETSKQRTFSFKVKKLESLRKYYESVSWPFEYDSDKTDWNRSDGDSDLDSLSSIASENKELKH